MKFLNYYTSILITIFVIVITGCESEEPLSNSGFGDANYIELPRLNTFYEVTSSVNSNWTVLEFPEWAAPMEESGTAGDKLELFVETNDEDEDRTSTLRVKYADGSETIYTLMQHGLITDGDNGTELSSSDLRKSYGVGFTTNVFLSSNTSKYHVYPTSPINFKNLKVALDKAGESDGMVDEKRYYSRIETMTGSSTSSLANQLSINAGLEVGITGFKTNIEAGYDEKISADNNCEYAIEEIQHIVGSRHMRPGMLKYFNDSTINIFSSTFSNYRQQIAAQPNNQSVMKKIITTYGTHIITQGSLGGELKLSMQMVVGNSIKSSDIHAALEIGTKGLNAEGSFDMSNKQKQISEKTTISLVTYGGENVFTINPGATFQNFLENVKDKDKQNAWVEKFRHYNDNDSAKAASNASLIDVELYPIYELMPTPESRNALRDYIVDVYQAEIYSAQDSEYPGPDLYVLQGFNPSVDAENVCSVSIKEIDMEIMACHTKIKELSSDEYSTVIYSGNIGKINTDRGFFVGSATRKPCKFKRERDGKFTTEVFEHLEKGTLQELYVDATGDITIFPKSSTDLYRTVAFTQWQYDYLDLSTISDSEYTLSQSKILFGNSNVNLTLNPNVKVSLANATVGKVTCKGNATIFGMANTLNSVRSVIPGPSGSTLIIDGSGNINFKAGISMGSGEFGNITINGGELTFIGGSGPAIGTTYDGSCGDITINGGTITAKTAGPTSAAIGTGRYGKCGRIFISRNIDLLTVKKGAYALNAIGQGDESGSCGEVVIENKSKIREL